MATAAEQPQTAGEPPARPGGRTLKEEMSYVSRLDNTSYEIRPGFVDGMRVPGRFYVNPQLEKLVFGELELACERTSDGGGFLPAVKQIANVATLPGIVAGSLAMPDLHSGYGFAIGNVAAFDMDDPEAVVSPGGVGFDINCGVRLLRTNLTEADVGDKKELLAQTLFDHIPVGVGSQGIIPTTSASLCEALELGMDWSLRQGYAWPEDKEHWCVWYSLCHPSSVWIVMVSALARCGVLACMLVAVCVDIDIPWPLLVTPLSCIGSMVLAGRPSRAPQRRVWPHARGGCVQGVCARAEAGPPPAGHPGCRQPLCGNPGGGRDL